MNITKRHLGRIIRNSENPKLARRIARLDRAWRLDGKREGRLENDLAYTLGLMTRTATDGHRAYDMGRVIQCHSAKLLGDRSGWESYCKI